MTGRGPAAIWCGYDEYELRSALRKAIKLNDQQGAIYWACAMLDGGGDTGKKALAKQMLVMATEDCYGDEIYLRAAMTFSMLPKIAETDALLYLVARMCEAPKWWESEAGRSVDRDWAKAIGDLKDPAKRREIPSCALDRHTRRGWTIFRKTGQFDDRFTGTDLGRQKTVWLYLRDGQLWYDTPFDDQDPGFLKHWREFRDLMMPTGNDIQPNDPLERGAGMTDDPCLGDALFDETEVGGAPSA